MGKRVGALVVTLGMVFATLVGTSGPTSAAPAPQAPTVVQDVEVAAPLPCWVTPKPGNAVNVRRQPNTGAERLGIMYPGQTADAACTATSGGSYTACGGTSTWWIRVVWTGATGYVAQLCVNWYYD